MIMRRRIGEAMMALAALILAVSVMPAARADDATPPAATQAPTFGWMLLTGGGRPNALLRDGIPALTQAGFRIDTSSVEAGPKVLIIYPRAISTDGELGVLQQVLKEGAGLVLIYSLSSDLQEITQKILEPWGVELSPARLDTDKTDMTLHPITEGLDKFFLWRVGANLKGIDPLIKQGPNVLAGTSTKGGPRLVVLPLDAVVPGQEADPIPVPNLQLLIQAAQWAAGVKVGAHPEPPKPQPEAPAPDAKPQTSTGAKPDAAGGAQAAPAEETKPAEAPLVQGPQLPTSAPADRGSYAKTAFLDITRTDEDWPAIADAARKLAEDAGLKVILAPKPRPSAAPKAGDKPKSIDPADLPLVKVLRDNPALVILSSCRQYDEAESLALATYVQSGGAVLALPRGTEKSNERMVWLNGALEKFGVAASLGRPGGTVRLDPAVISLGVDAIGDIPGGSLMVGYRGNDIAYVGAFSAARVLTLGAGRLALLDPLPLIQPDAKAAPAKAWSAMAAGVLRWLLFGMKMTD